MKKNNFQFKSQHMTYRLKIILRISIILLLGALGIYVFTQTYIWLVGLWLFLFFALAIVELIRFLERSRRDLANFLVSIQQNDFTNTYPLKKGEHEDLYRAFTIIINEYKKLRMERESNYHFLQAVVEHTTVPMIGFQIANGEISLMNEAAKGLLKKPYLKSISAIKPINKDLYKIIERLESEKKELIKIMINGALLNLSVSAKEIKLNNAQFKLVALQNIKAELDEKELESWQKLIRVLTHEIKNSAIPISTLTEVVNQMITKEDGTLKNLSTLGKEDLDDLKLGLNTVEKRSKGLVKFVNAYGELAKLPQPQLAQVNIKTLVDNVAVLLKNDLEKHTITLTVNVANKTIDADSELIEQVIINLIKNAREALKDGENPTIHISSIDREAGHSTLVVQDNGPGIDQETLEHIFIPFYTTKKEGLGIGLSLSKQIMRAHKGDISVQSSPGEGTRFYLQF